MEFIPLMSKAMMHINTTLLKIVLLNKMLAKAGNPNQKEASLSLITMRYLYEELTDLIIADNRVRDELFVKTMRGGNCRLFKFFPRIFFTKAISRSMKDGSC
jgi:hypothetical protein